MPAGKELWVQTDVVVFDNTGKLYAIVPQQPHYSNTEKIREGHSAVPILITPNIDMQIPEELKGELKIVQCISKYWVE